ncbi:MAG: hypothetical protein ACP5M4_08775 [Acidobacteriaceae bacterium]
MTLSTLSKTSLRGVTLSAILVLLIFLSVMPSLAQSSGHIVSNGALQQQVQKQSNSRQQNIKAVTNFFSTPLAQRAMKIEHISPTQVKKAIPTLSDSELANLSSRANQAQQQFSAGNLSTSQMLLLIIILLIVVILVAVH